MLNVIDLTLAYGERVLFKDVNVKFTPGNCYGLIGANGSGKSTFLNILSKEVEANRGEILKGPNERIAVLQQDQFAFDDYIVLDTVIMGHKRLYDVLKEKDSIYEKENFSEEDGIRASELEEACDEMNGYEAETEASILLKGLGIDEDKKDSLMKHLDGGEKMRVLLAQAMFGNPDILLLDEPTNHLDLESIKWLENFLFRFSNTVIVVSHDRHFLNAVCTHVADIDFNTIKVYVGNYDFWSMSSQIISNQKKDENRKKEDKIKELRAFVERFSSNASKAKQATSRKKLIEKLHVEDMPASSRRFPYVAFKPDRECGKSILTIEGLNKSIDGIPVIKDLDLIVAKKDKIIVLSQNPLARTALFQILNGEIEADSGEYAWGVTITKSYFPKENSSFFKDKMNLITWLSQYSENKEENFIRSFLGRMLFSGEEALKSIDVLSGGEKVRCLLSMMMLSGANFLMMDEPTSHLDLESITALNNGMINYPEAILFSSHDHQFINSTANRIVELTNAGVIDRYMTFDEYIENSEIQKLRDEMYDGHMAISL